MIASTCFLNRCAVCRRLIVWELGLGSLSGGTRSVMKSSGYRADRYGAGIVFGIHMFPAKYSEAVRVSLIIVLRGIYSRPGLV